MEIDRPKEEPLSARQELLNRIYSKFFTFPSIDVDAYRKKLIATKFSHYFPDGTTTPRFTDQISGRYSLEDGELVIFYAKGIFAGRITLKKNPETNNVDLVNFVTFKKDNQIEKGGGFSMIPTIKESGKPMKPYLHAIESLLNQAEAGMETDPNFFKTQIMSEEEKRKATKEKFHKKLLGIIEGRLAKKQIIQEKAKKKKKNGRKRVYSV